jgi:hypothetical protein
MPNFVFSYHIVPYGGTRAEALVNGMLSTGSLETAMKHVRTVSALNLTGRSNLEVILRDMRENEICRVPYVGSGEA